MIEKRLLQIAVSVGCIVPIVGGGIGVWRGPVLGDLPVPSDLNSHYRYLSGLLLGIGIGFLSTIPKIESHTSRFGLLTAIVILGGIGRLVAVAMTGWPSAGMSAALAMELAVTPSLALWQRRVARRASASV